MTLHRWFVITIFDKCLIIVPRHFSYDLKWFSTKPTKDSTVSTVLPELDRKFYDENGYCIIYGNP